MCNCGDRGQKFLAGVGATNGSCTCCGKAGDVVKLPVGAGHIYNCAPCLNPNARQKRQKPFVQKPHVPGVRFVLKEHIPLSFWRALENDHTPIRNDHPSAQRQKAADNFKTQIYDGDYE